MSYKSVIFVFIMLATNCYASDLEWSEFTTPSSGKAEAIGSYANGCLSGGTALPLEGEGYQVIRSSRKRYYGHPDLIEFIEDFSRQIHKLSNQDLLIGDVSMPRGGDFTSGHASHQIGLDVDIWFRRATKALTQEQKESPTELNVVTQEKFKLNANWHQDLAEMIRLAAQDPRVARVFVNPVIKQELCRKSLQTSVSKDNDWLNKVRPWWGHSYHMHVRLRCPKGDSQCKNQQAPKQGNGCEDIAWWKRQLYGVKLVDDKVEKPHAKSTKVKPRQCAQLSK
ncbi:penicillin-insensitive murein endopeptidase [Shewanella violacea]|uniref:Penicillin-insensitive murein endopeptidase, putative n=1 Tax=Shewanella violacea (strain JCM 10179 / CIP 106290 / LMG 19151 / DSS12) TaxID=637905 RepID=D4ZCJ1_SHEVD|nr:penicillin-insensitive murein endopeptidase [Shewanella violacea]BAJ03736.1 penicillin-insensitive murein endopeptidase, putative [Shewanella violacea DSS12]